MMKKSGKPPTLTPHIAQSLHHCKIMVNGNENSDGQWQCERPEGGVLKRITFYRERHPVTRDLPECGVG